MKKMFSFPVLAFCACLSWISQSCKEPELPGSIYGTVTDKATGEPINAAGVELHPDGFKTVTGSEGQFEFAELESGDYTLAITKTGYIDLTDINVAVKAGIQTKSDIQLEKLPPALRVVDGEGNDIAELDFGLAEADVARSFNIFNDGSNSLQWEITTTADWIKSVSKSSGELRAGATQSLILTIDREKLKGGENTTTMHITSNDGSKQVTVKAQSAEKSLPGMNMLQVSDIKMSTAVFHAEITHTGAPSYTERGFVYAASSMPTLDNTLAKLTAPVNEESAYTATATNLQTEQTYYVRAYAINDLGVNYSTNETSFKTQMILPEVNTGAVSDKSIANGRASVEGTIVDAGEPAYTERGFAYGVNHNPTVEDDAKKVASGSGIGVFSANLTHLAEGNVYYIRAYATNAKGTAYGSEAVLDFHAVLPEVRTDAVSDISPTSATLNGTIISVGDPAYTERGFIYGTMPVPTLDEPEIIREVVSGTSTGAYTRSLSGLTEQEAYYARAYAQSGENTAYGDIVRFVVSSPDYIILEDAGIMVQSENSGRADWYDANMMCENSTVAGYTDWRLPTIDELMAIYNNKDKIPNLCDDGTSYSCRYWSSTSLGTSNHKYLDMRNGSSGTLGNDYEAYVRAVRSITPSNK